MKLAELKNKKILIVGAGIEGKAVKEYLSSHLKGGKLTLVDKNDGRDYLDKQKDYDIAIKSPGVKAEVLKIPYTTATNIFLANARGKVIGVTGTKGKSTTSILIFEMLRKQGLNAYLGGNIGQSPLDFLDKLTDQDWTVLEMSSFQLKDVGKSPADAKAMAGKPHIAVLLMLSQEHLDYHKTLKDYIDSKRNILRFQKETDFAVINKDYPASHESDVHTVGQIFRISREREVGNGCFVDEQAIWFSRDGKKEKIIDINKIKLLGKHNLENVCAAACTVFLAGVSKESIAKVLKEFGGLPHRLEFAGVKNGITFYNDSLATIPEASIEAMDALPDTETLIAGGHDRGLTFSTLAQYLSKGQIKTLILFPPSGARIWEELCKITSEKNRPEKFDVSSMEQAVRIARAETASGKICLLSPASASFGIFKDYKDRGDQFKKEIRKLNPGS